MAPEKRHITRNRTSYSCQTCRRRKVKCDKKHPICGTCEKTNEECIYSTENSDQHVGDEHAPELVRKRKLESDFSDEKPDSVESPATASLTGKLARIRALLDEASALAEGVGKDHVATAIRPSEEHAAESLQSISEMLKSLDLRLRSGIKDNGKITANANPQSSHHPSRINVEDSRPHLNLPPKQFWEGDGANRSVTDEQRNVLFRSWLFSAYTIFPIVDPFDALEKFNAHHHWYKHDYDKGIPNPMEDFMPLIIAIQYGGLVGLSLRGVRRWFPEVPRRLLLAGLRLGFWRSIDKVSPSPYTVAAEVMMRYLCQERFGLARSSAQLAMLIRNAQAIGIYRLDKSIKYAASSQILRRLWWEIVSLDTSLSSTCLVPPLLDNHFFDDMLPSELKNHKMGTDESFAYRLASQTKDVALPLADFAFDDARPSIISVHHLVSRARAMLTIATRDIATLLMGTEPVTTTHITRVSQIIGTINADIRAMINRIPTNDAPEMNEPPFPSTKGESVAMDNGAVNGEPIIRSEVEYHLGKTAHFDEPHMPFLHLIELSANTFHKWARITLSMMLDQICCFAFFPFLKNPKSRIWGLTRDCAMQGCLNFFRKYLMLATNIELERYRWTWIGMFQPGHAAKIMLIDLYERPFSNEGVRSRSLFDQVLLLGYPEYGIVGGDQGLTFLYALENENQESCSVMTELRAKAWQKAGLDPAYLWNEEDQLQVLRGRPNGVSYNGNPVAGPVRPDQPELLKKLVDEQEWRHNPTTAKRSPFDGLTELIQRIRGSHPTESEPNVQPQSSEPVASSSNFYGEQLFTRSDDSWTPGYSLHGSQTEHSTAIANTPGTGHDATNTSLSYSSVQRHTAEESPLAVPYVLPNGLEPTGSNKAFAPTSDGQIGPILMPTSHTTSDLNVSMDSTQQYLPEAAVLDFDWSRWDAAFGYPGSNNIQSLASNNADLLVDAFGHS